MHKNQNIYGTSRPPVSSLVTSLFHSHCPIFSPFLKRSTLPPAKELFFLSLLPSCIFLSTYHLLHQTHTYTLCPLTIIHPLVHSSEFTSSVHPFLIHSKRISFLYNIFLWHYYFFFIQSTYLHLYFYISEIIWVIPISPVNSMRTSL